MARVVDPASVVVDQENLIQGVAKHFLQKIFGPEGLPWGTHAPMPPCPPQSLDWLVHQAHPTTAASPPIPRGSIPGPGPRPSWSASGPWSPEQPTPSYRLSEGESPSCAPGNAGPSIFDEVPIASSLEAF